MSSGVLTILRIHEDRTCKMSPPPSAVFCRNHGLSPYLSRPVMLCFSGFLHECKKGSVSCGGRTHVRMRGPSKSAPAGKKQTRHGIAASVNLQVICLAET